MRNSPRFPVLLKFDEFYQMVHHSWFTPVCVASKPGSISEVILLLQSFRWFIEYSRKFTAKNSEEKCWKIYLKVGTLSPSASYTANALGQAATHRNWFNMLSIMFMMWFNYGYVLTQINFIFKASVSWQTEKFVYSLNMRMAFVFKNILTFRVYVYLQVRLADVETFWIECGSKSMTNTK